MRRTRAWRRHKDYAKARRKRAIVRKWRIGEWYDNLHEYSKNKIHCSCSICRCKTNSHKVPHPRGPAMQWSAADMRRIEAMSEQEVDDGGAD